jgi:Polysulphide reductase, NrfD
MTAHANGEASASYYGRPVVKPHVWTPLIPWYFWIGGMAGAASVQCVAARARGDDELAVVCKRAALAGAMIAPVLLIADLGVPARFLNMLRVFKPTSPMSVGSWVLCAFGGAVTASTAAEMLGWARTSRALEIVTAALGPVLTVYTAVLVADTATPVWHDAYDTLPFVFAASGVAGAGAVASAFAPPAQSALPRRLMIAGALALPVAGQVMEKRLGSFIAEPYRVGKGGSFRRASAFLSLAGAALGILGGKSRTVTRVAAACVVAAGVFERFAVSAAGTQSARDPKYVVQPQRARVDAAGG